jgi:RHS repeat-associated protein
MGMPGRKFTSGSVTYRYGFNGKEEDDEVKGDGNQQDYGMRIYDPRLGRFLSVDPVSDAYPWNSTFSYSEGDPINYVDIDGLEQGAVQAQAAIRTTAPQLSNFYVGSDGVLRNSNQLFTSGTVNSGAYAPQTRVTLTQERLQAAVPYGAQTAEVSRDKEGNIFVSGYNANGLPYSNQVYSVHKPVTLKQLVDQNKRNAERNERIQLAEQLKNSIYSEKLSGFASNALAPPQKFVTNVEDLKAEDILQIKERIDKGVGSEIDHFYAGQLRIRRLFYEINPKHDPTKPVGGSNASVLPNNHKDLWDNRIGYDDASDTWWSIEKKGKKTVFHRFSGDGNGNYHWSGSTGEDKNRNGQAVKSNLKVPKTIRTRIK